MSRVVTVTVSEADIANGRPKVGKRCPVALALLRATGVQYHLTSFDVWLPDPERAWGFLSGTGHALPPSAVKWIQDFDNGKPVEPATFEIEVSE